MKKRKLATREIIDHKLPGDDANNTLTIKSTPACEHDGNAVQRYLIQGEGCEQSITFLTGAKGSPERSPGVTDQALLAVIIDRTRNFQTGEYACRENDIVITKLEEALLWMKKRRLDRINRGVLGQHAK